VMVKAGADRQRIHSVLRQHAITALSSAEDKRGENLFNLISNDPQVLQYLEKPVILSIMRSRDYYGFAPEQARRTAEYISSSIQ